MGALGEDGGEVAAQGGGHGGVGGFVEHGGQLVVHVGQQPHVVGHGGVDAAVAQVVVNAVARCLRDCANEQEGCQA